LGIFHDTSRDKAQAGISKAVGIDRNKAAETAEIRHIQGKDVAHAMHKPRAKVGLFDICQKCFRAG